MKYLTRKYPNNNYGLWRDFEDFFSAPTPFMPSFGALSNWNNQLHQPAIDLFEDESHYFVQAELPGFKRKEINVELENDRLVLKGMRKENGKDGEAEISFNRSVTVPNSVKADKVSAKYENGLLTVTIPKADEVKPRRIEVNS